MVYPANFLSCVTDYIEDMVTFIALAKIYSTEYFCNTNVAGLGEIFKFSIVMMYRILIGLVDSVTRNIHLNFPTSVDIIPSRFLEPQNI